MSRITAIWVLTLMLAVSSMGCVAVVRTHPPAARVEVRSEPPYADAVWIEGYWQRRHNDWVWIGGHWQRRPSRGAEWVPGYWAETPRGWRWIPGRWRR